MNIIFDINGNILCGPNVFDTNIPEGMYRAEIADWPTKSNGEPYLKSELRWNGKEIVVKGNDVLIAESNEKKIAELKKHIYENWLDSGKTQDEIKKQFKTIEESILSKKSVDVSDEIKNFKKWMEEK